MNVPVEKQISGDNTTDSAFDAIRNCFRGVRRHSDAIGTLVIPEDCVVQSMPDASPLRWHLAHTTWFFETFVLANLPDYRPINAAFEYLFNSYYNAVGDQFPRDQRGLLSRPSVAEIQQYRCRVNDAMERFFDDPAVCSEANLRIIELGLHHEQQHQELMLTDIKHAFSCNPIYPVLLDAPLRTSNSKPDRGWRGFEAGVHRIGHDGNGFAFDNESPRHRVFVEPFELATHLVTNGDFQEFIADDGYRRSELWLSLGWATAQRENWKSPLYWIDRGQDGWYEFTSAGLLPLDRSGPVTHISYFEADAFARWSSLRSAGVRLPTEFEWEIASADQPVSGWFAEDLMDAGLAIHPSHQNASENAEVIFDAMFGSTWQWTSSSYSAYPGYQPPDGALGEYNGKFMCNQYVLRGGSCATSRRHVRRTYRNFFPPDARWQYTGVRLARSR